MKKLIIKGNTDYPIYIKNGLYKSIVELIDNFKYDEICIIYDSKINIDPLKDINIDKHFYEIEVSEKKKSWNTFEDLINFFVKNKIKKVNTVVIAVGGGVVSDLAGFASSIYMRGVDYVIVPTTLNGMVDAAIGSKNGIDFRNNKNQIGTFYDPKFIIIDPLFLETLPSREVNSGIAEIIKIAFLSKIDLIKLLEKKHKDWEKIIYFSINEKNKFLKQDFYDKKERQYLNFGHTFGHALESYYNFEKYTHGEAIAIGMCLAFPHELLIKTLKLFNLPTVVENDFNVIQLYDLMKHDKKRQDNKSIKIVTLSSIEHPTFSKIDNHFDVLKKIELLKINEQTFTK